MYVYVQPICQATQNGYDYRKKKMLHCIYSKHPETYLLFTYDLVLSLDYPQREREREITIAFIELILSCVNVNIFTN